VTMTRQDLRQQLEDVIDRQLVAHHGVTWSEMERNGNQAIDASRRVILAAVDEWAASQAGDAGIMRAAAAVLDGLDPGAGHVLPALPGCFDADLHGVGFVEVEPRAAAVAGGRGRNRPDGSACMVLLRSGLPFASLLDAP